MTMTIQADEAFRSNPATNPTYDMRRIVLVGTDHDYLDFLRFCKRGLYHFDKEYLYEDYISGNTVQLPKPM